MKRIKPSSRAKVELSEVFLEVNVQYSVSFLRTRPFLRVNDSFHIQCPNGKLPVSAYSTDPWVFALKIVIPGLGPVSITEIVFTNDADWYRVCTRIEISLRRAWA